MKIDKGDLNKINDYIWEIPKNFKADSLDKLGINMKVPARIYASEKLLQSIWQDQSLEQLVNTATLPGVYKYTLAMPDVHEGYGCPIGGVIATDVKNGIISPGAIGYDINCGVRSLISNVTVQDIQSTLGELINELFNNIPSGVGVGGRIKLTDDSMNQVLEKGAEFMVEKGYGQSEDLMATEENGRLKSAKSFLVSPRAKSRGRDQLGTLGAGNHFLEIQKVDTIYDNEIASKWNLVKDRITILIHTGSRGLGHQNCADYVNLMRQAIQKYQIKLPDPELACAPFSSEEGQKYFQAMNAAANFAWANRQVLVHFVRMAWQKTMKGKIKDLTLKQLYDVAHNIAKLEMQIITDGKTDKNGYDIRLNRRLNQFKSALLVHRKGATRAFKDQPVIIPGSMGTASYLLVGQEKSKETFSTVCHGAGRLMSRKQAIRESQGKDIQKQLAQKGIIIKSKSRRGLAEEAPLAYKNVDEVVEVVHQTGLARKVARLVPLGVIKG